MHNLIDYSTSLYSQGSHSNKIFTIQKIAKPIIQNDNSDATISDSEEEKENTNFQTYTSIESVKIPEFLNDLPLHNSQNKLDLYEKYLNMFKDKEDIDLYCVPMENFLN